MNFSEMKNSIFNFRSTPEASENEIFHSFIESINNAIGNHASYDLSSNEDYENYANDTQKEIEDTGKIIEAIYIKNKITIKKATY